MSELYLVHHGINGQKWGKKNGPPYPLTASQHSSSEKKAGTKGWTKDAKEMSDDELRKAIHRKRLENEYRRYASEMGKNKAINDSLNVASKTFRTTGKVARVVSKSNEIKSQEVIDNIDDDDNLTKKEKKEAKKNVKEYKTKMKADVVANVSNQVANNTNKKIYVKDSTDLTKLTDASLKKKVDRLALESQYNNLYGIKTGKTYAMEILDTVGDIAEITGTALTLYMIIKNLKKL